MKIYPSIHKIKSVDTQIVDTDLNIPIAYIDTETLSYTITKTISSQYSNDIKKEIIPGQEFDSLNIKAFNRFGENVDITKYFIRKGDKYIYSPEMISFTPQTFLYKATIKKDMNYSIGNNYNIKAICVDDPDSLDLSQRLASILINPSDREKLPSNISINDNVQNIAAITTGSMKDTDFVFIESPDGIHYDDTESPTKIELDELLDNHVNVWISIEYSTNFDMRDYGVDQQFNIRNPIVHNNSSVECKTAFNFSKIIDKANITYYNIFKEETFVPVIIEEHLGKGFVIYSHQEVLQNPQKYTSIIYETMMHCYLKSYASTELTKEWISDELPDYHIVNSRLSKKQSFMSYLNLNNYFRLKNSEMFLYNVEIYDDPNAVRYYEDTTIDSKGVRAKTTISSSNISHSGFCNGHIMFNKNKTKTLYSLKDPEKPYNWVSIYNGSEIIYVDSIYYLIEESLNDKVFVEERSDNLLIQISPFKNSLKNIHNMYTTNINIPLFKSTNDGLTKIRSSNYFIYMKNNEIRFCDEYEWDNSNDLMFSINIEQNSNSTSVFDMRQLGGGLPEDEQDNYNLLDIGHINGRPYRKAGTFIVKLPTKYKSLEDDILAAINKYMSAEEYPIIIFEDEEE